MKVFLAASTTGITKADREIVIRKNPPKYLLETFYSGTSKCDKVLADVSVDNFLLDSGAFTFMHTKTNVTKKEIDYYTDQLIDYIKTRGIKYFFEMDIETILGLNKVEELRHRIEQKTGQQCIPVWHKERGIQYFKWMTKNYRYIAIGGMVVGRNRPITALSKMVKYAKDRGVKVHGLGFTDLTHLNSIDWYSVDSCSWVKSAVRGGRVHRFTGTTIKAEPVKKMVLN